MNLVGNLIALPGPLLDDGLAWMLAVEARTEARDMGRRS